MENGEGSSDETGLGLWQEKGESCAETGHDGGGEVAWMGDEMGKILAENLWSLCTSLAACAQRCYERWWYWTVEQTGHFTPREASCLSARYGRPNTFCFVLLQIVRWGKSVLGSGDFLAMIKLARIKSKFTPSSAERRVYRAFLQPCWRFLNFNSLKDMAPRYWANHRHPRLRCMKNKKNNEAIGMQDLWISNSRSKFRDF
jgi:hypothetical protein